MPWLTCTSVLAVLFSLSGVTAPPGGANPILTRSPLVPLERASAADPALGRPSPPEIQSILKSKGEGYDVVHSVAYVRAPLTEVLTALKDPSVLVARKLVNSWSFEKSSEDSIRISHVAKKLITVNFDTTWKFSVLEGSTEAPKAILVRGSKTAGTSYIRLLEDSIVARDIGGGVTRLEFVRHQNIVSAGGDEAEEYLRDVFSRLKARVHGEPLPPVK